MAFRKQRLWRGVVGAKKTIRERGRFAETSLGKILVVQKDGFFSKRASLDEWVGVKVDLVIWDHALTHSYPVPS